MMYLGMHRDTGEAITDIYHILQSMRDMLITPEGSRIARRDYGSLLSVLIDQPQNEALRLQIMSACYMALLKWEPCIKLTAISFESGSLANQSRDGGGGENAPPLYRHRKSQIQKNRFNERLKYMFYMIKFGGPCWV